MTQTEQIKTPNPEVAIEALEVRVAELESQLANAQKEGDKYRKLWLAEIEQRELYRTALIMIENMAKISQKI
ncbi:MAG: hypothetical protein HDS14_08425 [Bacteroides sp.]|nr:hypothetical protein [Bacteroides sp.]